MRIRMKGLEWDQFRDWSVYRADKGLRVLGRVDFIPSLGYWWQTADGAGVCGNLLEAKLKVEEAVSLASDVNVALEPRSHAEHVA